MRTDADLSAALAAIRTAAGLSQEALARRLGVSFVSVNRWERGATSPSPAQAQRILALHRELNRMGPAAPASADPFASRGTRQHGTPLLPSTGDAPNVRLLDRPGVPIIDRVSSGRFFSPGGDAAVAALLARNAGVEPVAAPPSAGMAAGKNTYTYDAHTYHTKVPPQGIAELLKHYLPEGGLVVDPFAGSGMTGVAAQTLGLDCILNELSPAASFISSRFTAAVDPIAFKAAIDRILGETQHVRASLYTTQCRECGRNTELLYTVWSYRVSCSTCQTGFQLWDVCRKYGRTVRDHRIESDFDCPQCGTRLAKSRLVRTVAEPVQVGYKCCGSRQQEVVHPPSPQDLEAIARIDDGALLAEGFYPTAPLPDGVNLSQPRRHGLDRIDRFYTRRNLSALSHLWRTIHRIEEEELAAHAAFVFTSLYQRVTRLSEFRFWGGSGNTARFNVPFISNEANVFVTFERKARTILDHLETTATHYRGTVVVVNNSATRLDYLPDASVDLIFTDPPFGANINYSEMNMLWEAWLGRFTDATDEAIVNRVQRKGVDEYRELMTTSLRECHRVLRPGRWLLLVFMNSSSQVWSALREAVISSGFDIRQVDIFDKQHGTFKQFVSENTAGYDLVLHCRKEDRLVPTESARLSLPDFLEQADLSRLKTVYLHVGRADELDVRKLYSEWTARMLLTGGPPLDLADFRAEVERLLRISS